MPKGNADMDGNVEPGDQLAAINGKSSIGMKVDDICAAISDAASRSKEVELTFLRYIGPFQPLPSNDRIAPTKPVEKKGASVDHLEVNVDRDGKPGSTRSILKLGKKKTSSAAQSKRVFGKRTFKWFGRGKKNTSKAE
jgi:C-terminal processing protease CtpA/Prc